MNNTEELLHSGDARPVSYEKQFEVENQGEDLTDEELSLWLAVFLPLARERAASGAA